MLSLKLHTN